MLSVASWKQWLYPQTEAWNPTTRFLRCLEQHLRPESDVLDIGAGAGDLNRYAFRGRVGKMIGVDLDPRVAVNPLLDAGHVASAYELPFADQSFDVAFSIYVLEHIDDPRRFVSEVSRVLRPGGVFLCLTPNKYHYVPMIAGLTPHQFHQWYNQKRGRAEEDTFPTCYRLNSRRDLRQHFFAHGFDRVSFEMIEVMPNYLMFSLPSFLAGAAYERMVNSTDLLQDLRVNVIGCFTKASAEACPERLAA